MLLPHMEDAFEILRFQNRLAGRFGPDMETTYKKVIEAIGKAGARWVVVGAHAVNVYVRPRATVDIDIVVEARRLNDVLDAIERDLGPLQQDDIGAATRLLNLSVDLIRSDTHVLFRAALDEASDRGGARVPPPELLVALKFLAAVSPWRKAADRGQDMVDLIRIYQTLGNKLDRDRALDHARAVYPGAERELAEIFDRVDRGEKVQV